MDGIYITKSTFVGLERKKEKGTSVSFTLTCDSRSPPPSHVRMSIGMWATQRLFSYADHLVSIRAMCSM